MTKEITFKQPEKECNLWQLMLCNLCYFKLKYFEDICPGFIHRIRNVTLKSYKENIYENLMLPNTKS